jgi:hypothetical protein
MTVIRFTDAKGKHLGDVRADGETLDPDRAVASVALSWTRAGKSAEAFVRRYSDWSNGYLVSKAQS